MNTIINTKCHGIAITHPKGDRAAASITSNLTESEQSANTAMNGIESMVLALFCAGFDITSPDILEAIETAVDGVLNMSDAPTETKDGVVLIEKQRRVTALVDETIQYEVNEGDWMQAVDEYKDESVALFELQRLLEVTRTYCDTNVVEVTFEHESSVSAI